MNEWKYLVIQCVLRNLSLALYMIQPTNKLQLLNMMGLENDDGQFKHMKL